MQLCHTNVTVQTKTQQLFIRELNVLVDLPPKPFSIIVDIYNMGRWLSKLGLSQAFGSLLELSFEPLEGAIFNYVMVRICT